MEVFPKMSGEIHGSILRYPLGLQIVALGSDIGP